MQRALIDIVCTSTVPKSVKKYDPDFLWNARRNGVQLKSCGGLVVSVSIVGSAKGAATLLYDVYLEAPYGTLVQQNGSALRGFLTSPQYFRTAHSSGFFLVDLFGDRGQGRR